MNRTSDVVLVGGSCVVGAGVVVDCLLHHGGAHIHMLFGAAVPVLPVIRAAWYRLRGGARVG